MDVLISKKMQRDDEILLKSGCNFFFNFKMTKAVRRHGLNDSFKYGRETLLKGETQYS
jgi:hypothetical protein